MSENVSRKPGCRWRSNRNFAISLSKGGGRIHRLLETMPSVLALVHLVYDWLLISQLFADSFQKSVSLYLTAEILELAGNTVRDNKKHRIVPRHLHILRLQSLPTSCKWISPLRACANCLFHI